METIKLTAKEYHNLITYDEWRHLEENQDKRNHQFIKIDTSDKILQFLTVMKVEIVNQENIDFRLHYQNIEIIPESKELVNE